MNNNGQVIINYRIPYELRFMILQLAVGTAAEDEFSSVGATAWI